MENKSNNLENVELTGNWNDLVIQDKTPSCFYARFEKQAAWLTFAVAMVTLMAAVYHVI